MGDLLTPLALGLGALVLFARGFRRLRGRGRRREAGWDRALLFGAGVLVGLAGLTVLHVPGEERASAHMLQHMLLGDLAPLLVLLALRGPLLHAVVPRWLRRQLVRPPLATLVRPAPSLALWSVLLWAWHVPVLYDAALRHEALHLLEHASFVVGGLLLWNVLIDPARRRALSLWGSLAYALAAMSIAQMLVMVLIVSYRPLYAYGDVADQSLAGLVMAVMQFITLGTFACLRLRAHFRAPLALADGHPLGT